MDIHKLIEEAKEEFRVFDSMGADTGRKILDLVIEATKHDGFLQCAQYTRCELTCMCKGITQVNRINGKYICCSCNKPLV